MSLENSSFESQLSLQKAKYLGANFNESIKIALKDGNINPNEINALQEAYLENKNKIIQISKENLSKLAQALNITNPRLKTVFDGLKNYKQENQDDSRILAEIAEPSPIDANNELNKFGLKIGDGLKLSNAQILENGNLKVYISFGDKHNAGRFVEISKGNNGKSLIIENSNSKLFEIKDNVIMKKEIKAEKTDKNPKENLTLAQTKKPESEQGQKEPSKSEKPPVESKKPSPEGENPESVQDEKQEKIYKKIFASYLGLEKGDLKDANLSSFLKVFQKVNGNTKEDWEKAGYEHDGMTFSDKELKLLNKMKKDYDSNTGDFKDKLDDIINYDKTKDGEYKNFLKEMKKHGHKTNREDSEFEKEKFNPTDINYVINFVSDINSDGKLETLNKEEKKWYYLWLASDKEQGQNLSETLMQETLSSKFKDIKSFNKLLTIFGIENIKPETNKEQLNKIKDKFWKTLIEKMTYLGANGNLEGFYQILEGKDKEYIKQNLEYDEKLDKKIDEVLNSKEGQIKDKVSELKNRYGFEKIESKDDLLRIKELLKGTIKQNTEIQRAIFIGSAGDVLGKLINKIDMGKYDGFIGFSISKKIAETEDKKGSVNTGSFLFIPYISASYTFTPHDSNKQAINPPELKGNYTIVPFAAVSLIGASVGVELNFNDKNKAINKCIASATKIFEKGENSYIKINGNGLSIDKNKIIVDNEIKEEKALKNLDEMIKILENKFKEYKTGNNILDKRLLDHLKIASVNYITNELYKNNDTWNISGISIGIVFSVFNPTSFSNFLGLNIQSRDQEFKEASLEEKMENKQKSVINAIENAKDATEGDLNNFGLKKVQLEKDGKKLDVLEYSGDLNNFYAGGEIQIQKINGKTYISGDIKSIIFAESSDNSSQEKFISFNSETENKNYSRKISSGIDSTSKIKLNSTSINTAAKTENTSNNFSVGLLGARTDISKQK